MFLGVYDLSSAGALLLPSLKSSSGAPSFYRPKGGADTLDVGAPTGGPNATVQHTAQSTQTTTVVANLSSDMHTAAPLTQGGLLLSRQLGARWSSAEAIM